METAPCFAEVAAMLPPAAPGVEEAALATLRCSNCVATSNLGVCHDRFTPEIQRATCANSTKFFEGRVTLRLATPRASIAAHADGKVVVTATPSHTSACNALLRTVRILARTTRMRGLVVVGCRPENKSFNFQMPAGVRLAPLTKMLQSHGLVAAYVPNTFPGCTITELFVGARADANEWGPPVGPSADAVAPQASAAAGQREGPPRASRRPASPQYESAPALARKYSVTVYGTGKVIISGLIIEDDVRAVARALVPVLWAFNQPRAWAALAARQKLLMERAVPSAAPVGHRQKKPRVDAESP